MTPPAAPSRRITPPTLAVVVALLVASGTARTAELPDWEDPQVVGIGKLEPHAAVHPFADRATAVSLDRTRSPLYRLLNGDWRFRFSPSPEARPRDFFLASFDDSAWDEVPVPSNIEKHGYAPPLLTGVVAQAGMPRSLADKFEALPFRIY